MRTVYKSLKRVEKRGWILAISFRVKKRWRIVHRIVHILNSSVVKFLFIFGLFHDNSHRNSLLFFDYYYIFAKKESRKDFYVFFMNEIFLFKSRSRLTLAKPTTFGNWTVCIFSTFVCKSYHVHLIFIL